MPLMIWGDSAVLKIEKKKFYVSQKIVATLTLNNTAFSFSDLAVDTGDNQDCIITKPDLNANNSITNSFGMVIQAPTYKFFIYPQEAGKLKLKPFSITYNEVQNYADDPKKVELTTNTLSIDVITPKGAPDGAFVLVTPELNITTTYKPDTAQMKIGDAFERTIKIRAVNIPDVLIEAVETQNPKEFNTYPSDPILKEKHSDSDAKITYAYRTQKENFVAIAGGEALIPSKDIYWFDGEKVHTITIDAKKISVTRTSGAGTAAKGTKAENRWLMVLFLILLLIIILYLNRIKIQNFFQTKEAAYVQSEKGHFHTLLKISRDGTIVEIYEAFYHWIDVAVPDTTLYSFEDITRREPILQGTIDQLQEGLVNPDKFDRQAFEKEIKLQRVQVIKKSSVEKYGLIESMN